MTNHSYPLINDLMNQFFLRRPALLLIGLSILLLASCRKTTEDIAPAPAVTTPVSTTGPVTDLEVNRWILANMRYAYYWTDKIPATPDTTQAPASFFSSLLYKYDRVLRPDGDRFSGIYPDAGQLQASLGGQNLSTGAEYRLQRRSAGSNDVIGVVLYIEHGSPAEKAGLKRGDIFYAINGQPLTVTNYADLLGTPSTLSYGLAAIQNGSIVNTNTTVTATKATVQSNPVYLDSTYSISGKKIGYLVYNQFIAGNYDTKGTEYNQALDGVFTRFKNNGISELVLDLRYNPGGGGDVATNLASLIAPGVSPTKVFFTQQYNPTLTAYFQQANGANFNVVNFVSKAANPGNLNRVFVLTTKGTASASELVINGLKPYMNVTIIGDTTAGKNVGSITISDKTGRIKWGLQPIIVKAFNSANQSDYTGGFFPSRVVQERLPLRQFGDVTDPLLGEALTQIVGSRPARLGVATGLLLPEVSSSVLERAGGGLLIVQPPKLRQ